MNCTVSNPLWDYSLATYRRDGVATSCIALQDQFNIDVNLLLYAAWLAQMNRSLSAVQLTEMEALVATWRDKVVRPLRALRRQLQDYSLAEELREEIKALELRAERTQQDMMYAFHRRAGELPLDENPLKNNLYQVARLASSEDQSWVGTITRLVDLLRA